MAAKKATETTRRLTTLVVHSAAAPAADIPPGLGPIVQEVYDARDAVMALE